MKNVFKKGPILRPAGILGNSHAIKAEMSRLKEAVKRDR